VSNLSLIVAMLTLMVLIRLRVLFPVMILLGPLIVLQFAYWRRRLGRERTTQQYLQAEPAHGKAAILG
jgi:hypothetical protein